jgi:NAD(P)-dependent dehydrogenase (short-subunit alcohol dehydrogenase family)
MPFPELDLDGRVALVTGAGRGIAGGVARILAEAGADVALNARTKQYAGPLAAEIARATGRRIEVFPADMTDPASVESTVAAVLASFGQIDVLVNGVGDAIASPLVPLPGAAERAEPGGALTVEDLDLTLSLNLTAALLSSRAVGPHMLERGSGVVVSIGSFAGLRGGAGTTIYAAGKSGLVGFTRALALEWAPYGVRVNAVAPGSFPDPVTSGDDGYRRAVEGARTRVPLGRVGELREAGLLVAYLASPAAAYITGQTLAIDGGSTL